MLVQRRHEGKVVEVGEKAIFRAIKSIPGTPYTGGDTVNVARTDALKWQSKGYGVLVGEEQTEEGDSDTQVEVLLNSDEPLSVTQLKGVGGKTAEALAAKEIYTLYDLMSADPDELGEIVTPDKLAQWKAQAAELLAANKE